MRPTQGHACNDVHAQLETAASDWPNLDLDVRGADWRSYLPVKGQRKTTTLNQLASWLQPQPACMPRVVELLRVTIGITY